MDRVYDYQKGRNVVPFTERYNFDVDKLVDAGVVFVTPAIEGDENSRNYKKWLKVPHTHLISLRNVKKARPDSWILKAITKSAPTSDWKKDFSKKLYDGKYNQILWSLDELGLDPEHFLVDEIRESISKHLTILREQKESKGWGTSEEKLSKDFQFEDFDEAIKFVNQIAKIAEQQNHHPDIEINYNKVKLSITDHEKGSVSEKCHKFVDAVNKLTSKKKSIEEDKTERFIKCRNCDHKFTQTIHKGKKSLPVCPYCGTHNTEKKEESEGVGAYAAPAFEMQPDHVHFKHPMGEDMKIDDWGRLHDEENKIEYPYKKIAKFLNWFKGEYGDYAERQGWAIFDSDSDLPDTKYKMEPGKKYKSYFQVQRIDSPEEGEAFFGRLKNDFEADELAKKLGLMLDEFGVVIGWDGENFL